MKAVVIERKEDNDSYIKRASQMLKSSLKKGDVNVTKPRLNNIKLKIMHFPSFIISKLSRGITHSCLYLGNGNVLEIGTTLTDSKIKKLSLESLLKSKMRLFGGVTVYAIQPKYYKLKHRERAVKLAVNNFLKRSKEVVFSHFNMLKLGLGLILKRNKFSGKELLKFKRDWNCSELTAHILKKANIKIGKRRAKFFLPSTFVFSKHFKTKKKVILKR